MSDSVPLRDVFAALRRLWWIPAFFAVCGIVAAQLASNQVPTIHRAEATVLVGPTEGAVTRTSTVRASEDLAAFYADMARRQLILEPVAEAVVGQGDAWAELRNDVKAVVPSANLRLVTVTVMGDTQEQAHALANGIVSQLVSLSPALPGGNSQAFINEQVDNLKQMMRDTQETIDRLEAEADAAAPDVARQLRQETVSHQERLIDLQRVYVEFIAVEPTTDAGGLTVLDEASAVTDLDRPAPTRQMFVGAVAGAAIGMVVAWLLQRRSRGKHADAGAPTVVAPADTPERTGRSSVAPRHTKRNVVANADPHSNGDGGVRRRDRVEVLATSSPGAASTPRLEE